MSQVVFAAILFMGSGAGQAADSLTVFKTGDTAKAAAVNANFKLIWNRMNSLAAENQDLARQVDSLKKASPRIAGDTLGSRLPIGSIVASVLPPSRFEASFGAKTWLLADGSRTDVPEYAAAFGTDRLPDLRGVFLRGLNVGRTDDYSDPAGETRSAGSVQGDATSLPDSAFIVGNAGAHTHTLELETTATRNFDVPGSPVARNTVASPSLGSSPKPALSSNGAHTHAFSGGDAETRPKNAAVFYYIKVR